CRSVPAFRAKRNGSTKSGPLRKACCERPGCNCRKGLWKCERIGIAEDPPSPSGRGQGEGLKICEDLRPSPGAPARWLSRRPLPEPQANRCYLPVQASILICSLLHKFKPEFDLQLAEPRQNPEPFPVPLISDFDEGNHRFV